MEDDKAMKEKVAFNELKKRMKGTMEDEMYEDDNMFYRFLKARDFKVDHSEAMLRQHLEWRKNIDFKHIKQWDPPEVLKKYFILTKIGHDKEGNVVKYVHLGQMDLKGMFQSCTTDEWLKTLCHFFEDDVIELQRQSKRLGRIVDKVIYIANVEDFTLAMATDKKIIYNIGTAIIMYLNNYPEVLKTVYGINVSMYFKIFFNVLKTFLPSTVLKKIRIYSDDSWRRDILEAIDAEIIPAFLGGKRTDPDGNPLCLTLIKSPDPVPKKFYLNKSKSSFSSLKNAEWISVSRGSVHEVPLTVKEPGSYLEWEFQAKPGDIKFGLFYKDENGSKAELIPLQRITTNDSTESGVFKCENKGCYILKFDNSYSYFKSKEIHYKIKIKKPEGKASSLTN